MQEELTSRSQFWRNRFLNIFARIRRLLPFLSGTLAAFLGLYLYQLVNPGPPQLSTRDVNIAVAEALASATPPPAFSSVVYQVIHPSLVLIQSDFPDKGEGEEHGLGSGVVVNDSGAILTSLHVVKDATDIEVTFADGEKSTAQVISSQPEIDIAMLLPTQPIDLIVPATLGNPNAMRVGDEAYAVGNPFGLYGSMSAGVISGFERTFQPPESEDRLEGLIQIDAAVNPGNSGGPLLNRYGQVIGIIVGIVNPTEQDVFIGIGFAVPITTAGGGGGFPPY